MFITLLITTFIISLIVSFLVIKLFSNSIEKILNRLIEDSLSNAWVKYLKFAIYVVGISSGVNVWKLSQYIGTSETKALELNFNTWVLEIYSNISGTLQGIAWLLIVFFIFALIGYVILRISELKNNRNKE